MANTTGDNKIFTNPWDTDRKLKINNAVPAAQTTYYAGQAVGRDTGGNMVQMDDTAKAEFLGILQDLVRTVVDTTDAAGDKIFLVEQPLLYTALIASAAAGDEGKKVYWLYNNQVAYTPGVSGNYAGTVWFVRDSTHVTILPPWVPAVTGGGHRAQVVLANANITLGKYDVNKTFTMVTATSTKTITLPAAVKCSPGDRMTFINLSSTTVQLALAPDSTIPDTVNNTTGYNVGTAVLSKVTIETDGISAWYIV